MFNIDNCQIFNRYLIHPFMTGQSFSLYDFCRPCRVTYGARFSVVSVTMGFRSARKSMPFNGTLKAPGLWKFLLQRLCLRLRTY